MPFFSKNNGEKVLILIFKALVSLLGLFVVENRLLLSFTKINFISRVTDNGKKGVLTVLFASVLLYGLVPNSVLSQETERGLVRGETEVLHLYPGSAKGEGWSGSSEALSPELGEDALYQNYNARNSAYITKTETHTTAEPVPQSETVPANTTESTSETAESDDVETEPTEEIAPAAQDEVSEPVSLQKAPQAFFAFLGFVTDRFPFVQETVTEEQVQSQAETPEVSSEDTPVIVEEPVTDAVEGEGISAETTEHDDSTQEDGLEQQVTDEASDESSEDETEQSSETNSIEEGTLVFSDFSVPDLDAGVSIASTQLRVSLGALREDGASGMPTLSLTYISGTEAQVVGTLFIEDEVSNAFNGGYALFALPEVVDLSELEDVEIRVQFEGDSADVDGVYIDALWFEVVTERIDTELLREKTKVDIEEEMEDPKRHTLLSSVRDFTAGELPQFSLKYIPQRNFAISSIRNLLGRDVMSIEQVEVIHQGLGELGIEPTVHVTPSGLIGIEVEEKDAALLQPGEYTLQIVTNEGGVEFIDTFDFQWGLLSVNTDKSTYTTGEGVTFALGALSSDGNTLCDAALNLYVISSEDIVEKVPVAPSGQCYGNNVTNVPDYTGTFTPTTPGTYEMYVERVNATGTVLAHTSDTFLVMDTLPLSIRRDGPTRIYPRATYPMRLSVEATDSWSGVLVERVPSNFEITQTDAEVVSGSDYHELTWNVSIEGPGTQTFSYTFDAPDISPILYQLGEARLEGEGNVVVSTEVSDTEAGETTAVTEQESQETDTDPVQENGTEDAVITADVSEEENVPTSDTTAQEPSLIETLIDLLPFVGGADEPAVPATESETVEEVPAVELLTPEPTSQVVAATSTDLLYENTPSSTSELIPQVGEQNVALSTASASVVFTEYRKWQIASDATGSMLLLWASSTIPTGWTCVSCTGGDPFYQRFVVGSSTAGVVGGAATHTHTASGAMSATANTITVGNGGGNNYASAAHTHTYTPTIGTASNLPVYRNLVVIQHNSAGEPTSVPARSIALFDAAVPSGWTQYSAQNGFYVRGESTANIGLTGGANTHTHTITGNTADNVSAAVNSAGGALAISNRTHSHSVSSSTAPQSNEPPHIGTILGRLAATTTMPDNAIAMWSDTPPSGWTNVSTSSAAFQNRFFKPSATYGTTGGTTNHTPADVLDIPSGAGNSSSGNNRGGTGQTRTTATHSHLVDVTGFSNATHLPPYRSAIFGKRAGGAPPNAPTVHVLFDDEKTGTSTPSFEFTALDPYGVDTLVYQFQWDDSVAGLSSSPLGDRSSDNETGCSPNCFTNTVNGGDTSPFTENERIRFSVQTALTDGTTYYYRVRAKKTIGAVWGEWSPVQALTYVSDTEPSQWFQTQDSQFSGNTLDNTETFGSNSVRIVQTTPTEALTAYGEGAVQTPRYQLWGGTSWGGELSALSVGGTIEWIKTAAGTTRDEYILGTQDAVNDVNVQVFNGTTNTWSNLIQVTNSISDSTRRGFDVAYETNSGDGLVVFCDGDTNPSYRTWDGTNWSGTSTITTTFSNSCNYIALASDPTSDEIIVVMRDTGALYEAQVWNGSSLLPSNTTFGSMTDAAHEGIGVEYEDSGGQAIVVVSNGNAASFLWNSWNGTEWGSPTPVTIGNDFEWGVLKRDEGTDNMALCYIDANADIGYIRWDGNSWQTPFKEFDIAGNNVNGLPVSCEYETTSGRDGYLMVPYSDDTGARYSFWNGTATTTEASINTINDSWEVGTARTGDGKILTYFHDDANTQYDFSYWNGTTWSSPTVTLEGTPSVTADPRKQPIDIVAQIYQPSLGDVTSPVIDFDFVSGRSSWGEALWSVTEPSGTDVLIQVLYATTTACTTPIPDGALAGNAAGFDLADVPLDLSGLSTTTYNSLCLRAILSSTNSSIPTLDDWTLSWERQPFLVQDDYRWYVNRNNENPIDVWPSGATDILENEFIPPEYAIGKDTVARLRMSIRSDNAPLSTDEKAFTLQYSESATCSTATVWNEVGAAGSSTAPWRGYNNLLGFDGSTISTLLLSSTDVGGTYEEENDSDTNPNMVAAGNQAEWDWVLQHNGATDGVQYCFRMVDSDGVPLDVYEEYPALFTNTSPGAPTLEKVFDNEQVASTSPWFEFVATDTEGNEVSYQVQVDDAYDFSSTALDRNSTTHFTEFENVVNLADKDPFTDGQTVRFKPTSALSNNTTYYWRVRATDINGSNDWGPWSTIQSFTVNTATAVTTWYQTTQEQFSTDDFTDTEATVSDDVILTTSFIVGTTTSTAIDFDDKTTGNAWGELSWNANLTDGAITYQVEYLNSGEWELVPDTFLPGNASGFSTSPVSLLSLDPQIHNEIRVRAVLEDVGGTPRLLDWSVSWGFAVEQPTLIALFDNEKVGTTTPRFRFTTVDPELDSLEYQIMWSTSTTFVSSTTRLSGTHAGYANTTNGGDTSPFNSGDTISYKVQSADVLTNGVTYWWRVRARDPLPGSDAWSVWSEPRSFTVDTGVTVSTWFQTKDEQFETNTLNDTEITGSDAVEITSVIREAFVAYIESTIQTPRYRLWNGTEWGEEETALSVGGSVRYLETAAAHSRDEYIIATQDSSGRVRAQVYNGSSDTTGNLQTIITAVPSAIARGFDVTYESASGDALVVACDGTEATYYVWDGTSWDGPDPIALGVAGSCNWIQLASDPASDEIILVARDDIAGATDYQAQVWNGTGWGNPTAFGSATEINNEGIAIGYEESSDQAVVVLPNTTNASFLSRRWTGTTWLTSSTTAIQDDFENGRIVRDQGSDNMVLCSIDQDGQMAYMRWNPSTNSWITPYVTIDTAGNSKVGRPFGCQYETTAGRDGYIMMPYSDTGAAQYRVFDGSTFPGENAISTIQDSFDIRSTRTGDGNILALFYDDVNTQYDFSFWNGTAWSVQETLESNSVPTTNPITTPLDVVSRIYPTFTTGTVLSSPIVFSEGSGLKWQSASFVDTTPGASAITYQVEYLNGGSWELIPNGALAGNSAGFTTSPIDLTAVSRVTYSTIRLRANLSCSGVDCPTLNDWSLQWSEGIVVSGTLKQYDQTASTTSGTVAVAVNGVLQSGKTASVSSGSWSIPNVQVFPGDIVTVFMQGAADSAEAVGVTLYDGDGDITGLTLFEKHLSIGSNEATTTPVTNADIGLYDFTQSEDLFFDVGATTLNMCADASCGNAELYVRRGAYYAPQGRIVGHDFENNGTFTAGSFTHELHGSWDNNATSTLTGSTIVFSATSSTESITSVGATVAAFNNITFGSTTGSGVWTLGNALDVDGILTVNRGTFARASTSVTIGGNLSINASGFVTGVGTTTFDGSSLATWSNANPVLQNAGKVVVDGISKAVVFGTNVAAESVYIGANDTLDASAGSFDITVYGNWNNQFNFVARSGDVIFAATTTGKIITTAGDAFYNVLFSGAGGAWSFTENTLNVSNDLSITAAGVVTLPTATTTIAGSFLNSGGTFAHNNGLLFFTSGSAESVTLGGTAFTNSLYNVRFTGAGSWAFTDANATTSNQFRITQGTVTLPSSKLTLLDTFTNSGGTFNHNNGTVRFISAGTEVIDTNASFNSLQFAGGGTYSFLDTNVTTLGTLSVTSGALTLPTGTFSLGGSLTNTATIIPNGGTVLFNSTDVGETINLGASPLYNATFNSASGGWTISESATTTNNFTLTAASTLTLASAKVLSVGGVFTNSVGGAATTWTGSTLSLEAGNYSLNTKANTGDTYATLRVDANTDIKMWNSSATAYVVDATGSLYSQDHTAVDGDLYIFGNYPRTSGTEYWSYATDFDGAALGGSPRQVDVRFASGASASFANATLHMVGTAAATTSIHNQGSGTYLIDISGGTTTASYFDVRSLGATGITLRNRTHLDSLTRGFLSPGVAAGTTLTIASSTIDANPGEQMYYLNFSTTTAITATNVTQSPGTPSSYWWFRNSSGNIDGESFDVDSGNPGTIRWDDSSLSVTIAGTVYTDEGVTPLVGGTCNGVTTPVRVVVEGGSSYTGSCSNVDGSFSIVGVAIVGDPTITVYLDGASGGERAVAVTKTVTGDVSGFNLYANRLITRHEDTAPLTIEDMVYDSTNDSDIFFTAATGTTDTLVVAANRSLFVSATTTFTPGGTVTLLGGGTGTSYDGSLTVGSGATFVASTSGTTTVGGSFTLRNSATFRHGTGTVLMTATTTGKAITVASGNEAIFNILRFSGSGGGWNLSGNARAVDDIHVSAGTLTGTGNVTVQNGSFYGNGLVSLGAGTTTLERTNTLGGSQGWTFSNLVLGNSSVAGTTTPASTATTTISGRLTIATAHRLDAGSGTFDLSGTGTVFVENGVFLEDTSKVRYSGGGATNIRSTAYYNLDLGALVGTPTYTATGLGIQVLGNLAVGGVAPTVANFNTNDTALDVNGNVFIRANGTLSASNIGSFTIAGNYDNDGTFTHNSGGVTFDGSGSSTIAPGASSFGSVAISGAGSFTVSESATTSSAFVIAAAGTFMLDSGRTLTVGGTFSNGISGAATTWTGSILRLISGTNFSLNAKTTSDTYATVSIGANTDVRMWNSSASSYSVNSSGSLYSQDHADVTGDVYIYGNYVGNGGTDYWSYGYDFDGSVLGGGSRQVDVRLQNGASVEILSGGLHVLGAVAASTSLQNQGSGSYSIRIGGNASTSWQYYDVEDVNSSGLTFSGSPRVVTLSRGDFEVTTGGGSAITVGGSVITTNPAKTFTNNVFATTSAIAAFNVTATGTTVSSWRFTNHNGNLAGEGKDNDPNGDPGYLVWDNSASNITISGNVYSDEGVTVSSVCDGSTNNVHLRVAGLTSYTTSCNATTSLYSISGVTFSPGDSLVVYIDGETEKAATITEDPVSNINDMHLYENRVIVRHEGIDPLSIADMAVYDSSDDADIPFTAVDAATDTLTLPANRKLLVWTGKEFRPTGNITLSGAGAGAAYDGTLEAQANATVRYANSENHSVGGSIIFGAGATLIAAQSTTTLTTTGAARTVDVNAATLHNLVFNGSGSWSVTDPTLGVHDVRILAGSLTLPTGTTTIAGSWNVTGGSFVVNGSPFVFTATDAGNVVRSNGSSFDDMYFTTSGSWSMTDTNATTTGSLIVSAGTLTLPSGILSVGSNFRNDGGTLVHNTSEILMRSGVSASLRARGSNLYAVTWNGAGPFTIADASLSMLDDVRFLQGAVTLATGTMSVGGSFTVGGGSFTHASGTILFNSTDTGELVNPGSSHFYNVSFAGVGGGWTVSGNATTTNNFSLTTASSFTVNSGVRLSVGGVFTNAVGGAATTWTGSTLVLSAGTTYAMNTKASGGDHYQTLIVGANTDISNWNSRATTTTVAASGSLYGQDYAAVDGALRIYGDYHISTTTAHWSYATDFDGTALGGSSRAVIVSIAQGATTTVDGGSLSMVGVSGSETTVTNQGSGTYAFIVSGGDFNAQHYKYRNVNSSGLTFIGTPSIATIANGDFELAVNGGSLMTLATSTLDANASMLFTGNRFATTTAITGTNITLVGTTSNAWTFAAHTGNLDGEDYDTDGATACGSIRWSDSDCLLTQQTHYRWRNDDGGIGVSASEWFNTNWDARKRVRIENTDPTTYTNAVVKVDVVFDTDMQSDFDDLHFTDASGTTTIPHFVDRMTPSTDATVWVKVPTLPSGETATVFMYYNNPTASSTGSIGNTFIAADDFEDGNDSEYSGDVSLFIEDATFAYGGAYGLDATGNESSRATDGMARFDQVVSQGEIIRYLQYINTGAGSGDETCTLFGVQSPVTANQNYAVCLEQFGTDRISLARDVDDTDSSGVILASSTVSFVTGWYEVEIDWQTDDDIIVNLSRNGSLVTSIQDTDGTYTGGGIGFTFWFQNGGWDNYTSRPRVDTEPTIRFGAEQQDGGATWKESPNTAASYNVADIARLRIAIENTGSIITGQTYELEYAEKGASPSCEAVSGGSYVSVPVQASCGSSPLCMQSTSYITGGGAATDLLFGPTLDFVLGEVVEDPSNVADAISLDQDEYTEIEYAMTPTVNATDPSYCLRVTNSGDALDTYLQVAELAMQFDPTITGVSINSGADISLIAGATTTVYATGTVTDLNGYADLAHATSTMYRSGVSGGAACSANNNDCYISSGAPKCTFTACAGYSCTVSCSADFYYHADATDATPYEGEEWLATIEIADSTGIIDQGTTASGVEVFTLQALDVSSAISYGALAVSSTTGAFNPTTTVQNLGNRPIDVQVEGSDLSDGSSSFIPAYEQRFATSSFNYTTCTTCFTLSSTSITALEVDLTKPVSTAPITDIVYWGIEIPFGVKSNPHSGTNIFYATGD